MALNKRERAIIKQAVILSKLSQPKITTSRRERLERAREDLNELLTSFWPGDFDELLEIVKEVHAEHDQREPRAP